MPEALPAPAHAEPLGRASLIFFIASLAMVFAVLLIQATRPYALWPNRSDDFFYYLLLARESVHHGVVSVDGLHPTNGFHPLYFLVLRALYPRVAESALPGVALALLACCHVVTSMVLWRTLRRISGSAIAGMIAGLYAANPFVLRIVFAGVESSFLALGLSVCLWAHLRWIEDGAGRHRWLSLAALALAVSARTDAVLLALGLAIAPALSRRRDGADALRAVNWAPLVAGALPVALFGAWSQAATGEFFQTSGRALSFWQSLNDWRVIREAVAGLGALTGAAAAVVYGLEIVVQFVGWLLRAPFELLRFHPLGTMLVGAGIVAHLVGAGGRREADARWPAGTGAPVARRLERELVIFMILLWGSYALLFRHCQIWYWHGSVLVAAILVAIRLAPLRDLAHDAITARLAARAPRIGGLLIMTVAIAFSGLALNDFLPRDRARAEAARSGSAERDPLSLVPDGATLGAFDTGQLGWEQPRLTVVNLDGLVNNAAFRALRARRIGEYMKSQGIGWLYVNDKVIARFHPFGLDTWLADAEPIASTPGGPVLYRAR